MTHDAPFDWVIAHATIVDGTGRKPFHGHVGLRDGRIAALVTTGDPPEGRQTLDATGLALAPGFVDCHSHADFILPLEDHGAILAPLLLQGVTTLITGNCGFSPAPITEVSRTLVAENAQTLLDRPFPSPWCSMGEFLDHLEAQGVAFNTGLLVGHGAVRAAVMGMRADAPAPEELRAMQELVRQSLRQGALGLSAGLAYAPGIFARNDELAALLRIVAEEGGLFTVHGRAYSWVSPFYSPMIVGTPHNVRSTRELLDLARQARVPLQLSHLIFVGRRTWRTSRTVLQDIHRAVEEGVNVAFDAFPYTVGNSTISVVFPEWFLNGLERNLQDPQALRRLERQITILRWTLGMDYDDIILLWARDPALRDLEGLDFGTIARRLGMSKFQAYIHVARASEGQARVLLGTYSGDETREEALQAVLADPLCAFMTDTILTRQGSHNPASFGTFPRILGRYSRDLGLFPLEEAVQRMTDYPARRFGLQGVGRIAEGYWADLVCFDPQAIADRTTLQRPDAPPVGVRAVWVSGHLVVQDGQVVDAGKHGRVLRRTG